MDSVKRYIEDPGISFFLFGPRGTGKTTWLKHNYCKALYLDLLDESLFRNLVSRPERIVEYIEGDEQKTIIIVDEIQKIPELLSIVHQQIEEKKYLQFILTGSSARKLHRTGVNLLAGRAVIRNCFPFIASEMGSLFSLNNALSFGMLPLVAASPNPLEVLSAYITLYIKEEVQMEGFVRNTGSFFRFMETISFSHGSLLNTSEIARESNVERKTVDNYITILEDLLLSYRIPVFSKRAKRKLIKHSKFYYFDTGVFNIIRPKGPLDKPEEIAGPALEGLVLQHLKAWIEYSGINSEIFFWRTKSGNEVDFILYGASNFYAIEIKNSGSIRKKDLHGLKAFIEDYPGAIPVLLYRGKDKLKIDNILCLPVEEFLKQLIPGKSLSAEFI